LVPKLAWNRYAFHITDSGPARPRLTERPVALPPEPQREASVPIKQFASETIRVLGVALEMTCIALRTGDCADDVKQAIANKLIDLANAGERNPDVLCEQALKEFFLTERQQRIAGVESRLPGRNASLSRRRGERTPPLKRVFAF
jgi:hypothetical protein